MTGYKLKDFAIYDKILIIGYPGMGKTTLFEDMAAMDEFSEHFKLHTDYYKDYNYKDQLYMIIDDISWREKWLVEGIQGYRLLRKYIQTEDYDLKPGAIIVCESTSRVPKSKHDRMIKGLNKIWEDYCDLEENLPKIFYFDVFENGRK